MDPQAHVSIISAATVVQFFLKSVVFNRLKGPEEDLKLFKNN